MPRGKPTVQIVCAISNLERNYQMAFHLEFMLLLAMYECAPFLFKASITRKFCLFCNNYLKCALLKFPTAFPTSAHWGSTLWLLLFILTPIWVRRMNNIPCTRVELISGNRPVFRLWMLNHQTFRYKERSQVYTTNVFWTWAP
jgi:hypothetical protein